MYIYIYIYIYIYKLCVPLFENNKLQLKAQFLKTGVTRKQSTPNFPKSEHIQHTCAHLHFRKIWRALFSCNTHFEIRPFVLLPTNCSVV